jgi:hypothetical protein
LLAVAIFAGLLMEGSLRRRLGIGTLALCFGFVTAVSPRWESLRASVAYSAVVQLLLIGGNLAVLCWGLRAPHPGAALRERLHPLENVQLT